MDQYERAITQAVEEHLPIVIIKPGKASYVLKDGATRQMFEALTDACTLILEDSLARIRKGRDYTKWNDRRAI